MGRPRRLDGRFSQRNIREHPNEVYDDVTFLACLNCARSGRLCFRVVDDRLWRLTYSDPTGNSFKWCGERIEPPNTCEPRGVGGETTALGVDRLLADLQLGLIPATTDYVVLGWGANDLRGDPWDAEARFFSPLSIAASALIAAGHVPLFWIPNPQFEGGTPPFVISPLVDDRISQVVAPGMLDLASSFDSAPLADHFDAYWSMGETEMALLYADHVHQNAEGYAFMASTVQAAANQHDFSVPEPGRLALSIAALVSVAVMVAFRVERIESVIDAPPLRAGQRRVR